MAILVVGAVLRRDCFEAGWRDRGVKSLLLEMKFLNQHRASPASSIEHPASSYLSFRHERIGIPFLEEGRSPP